MRKPGLLVPSFFLAAGCLMNVRSFSSMLKNVEMAVDLMVMQGSCCSFLGSVVQVFSAFEAAMMPALVTRESVRVDLPWSTWAFTDMFLMFTFLPMHSRLSSVVKLTMIPQEPALSALSPLPVHLFFCLGKMQAGLQQPRPSVSLCQGYMI